MANNDLRINILGTEITISTDEEPEYLAKLLEKYRQTIENVQRISGLRDPLKLAVLTGFLISDDLEKAGTRDKNEAGEAERITLSIMARLDAVVSEKDQEPAAPEEPLLPTPDEISGVVSDTFYRLNNPVKNYDWGSPEWIPELLRQKNPGRIPWAELWMGVHPAGPSHVVPGASSQANTDESGGEKAPLLLSELIEKDPQVFLGKETAEVFGKLPFLFKVLAAEKPLSIQVHPNPEQAKEGFEKENRIGIPLDAPNRNYRDANHKPEIICALSPFAALCGFRKPDEIQTLIEIISRGSYGALKTAFEGFISALKSISPEIRPGMGSFPQNPLNAFLALLFDLGEDTLKDLGPFIKSKIPMLKRDFPQYLNEWEYCSYLSGPAAGAFGEKGDPGIIAPLFLNIIEMEKGEAIYLPAGIFHAYIHGLGIELMADSDNVLRGGLTSKHIEPMELFRVLDFSDYLPEILKAPGPDTAWFSYPTPSKEFVLSVMNGSDHAIPYPETGPSIVLFIQGMAMVTDRETGSVAVFSGGESIFIPAGNNSNLLFSGLFTAYTASTASGRLLSDNSQ